MDDGIGRLRNTERHADGGRGRLGDQLRLAQSAQPVAEIEKGELALLVPPSRGDFEEQHREALAAKHEGVPLVPAAGRRHPVAERGGLAGLDHLRKTAYPLGSDAGQDLADRPAYRRRPRHADQPLPGRVDVDIAPVHRPAGAIAHQLADDEAFLQAIEQRTPVGLALRIRAWTPLRAIS